ncbi:MAG: DNA repair protein RecO [Candidatus Kapabacteria bacterium]|nr:DNA repair protein RecO [Candidatus Kapabacteria bacterium]
MESSAVVLRTRQFGDTSLLATVYTQQFGKCTVLAKGARTAGSSHRAVLEVPNHTYLAFYRSPRREVFLVRTAELQECFPRIRSSIEPTAAAFLIVESMLLTQQPDEPNPALYSLLVQALRAVEQSTHTPFAVAIAFLLRLASALGFAPSLQLQTTASEPTLSFVFRTDDGALIPLPHHSKGTVLQTAEVEFLRTLQRLPLELASQVDIPTELAHRLAQGLTQYLQHHLERPLRFRSLELWNIRPVSPSAE